MSRAKLKLMTKSLKPFVSKDCKPRGRSGGRNRLPPAEKKQQVIFYIPAWLLEAFLELVPQQVDRNKLVINWLRAYTIANGESDRLVAQSPVAAELAAYLEATDAPQELRDKLESLMVARASDEIKIAEGVTQVGDSLIV